MGAGASSQEIDLEVYRHLQNEYEKKQHELNGIEDPNNKDQIILEHLRNKYMEQCQLKNAEEKNEMNHDRSFEKEEKENDGKENKFNEDDLKTDLSMNEVVNEAKHYESKNPRGTVAHVIIPRSSHEIMLGDIVILRTNTQGNEISAVDGIVISKHIPNGMEEKEITYEMALKDGTILQRVTAEMIEKVIRWDSLELEDTVRVKDKNSCRYFEGIITGINKETGCVKVDYGEEEMEENITPDRIIKIASSRMTQAHHKWKVARTLINATKLFQLYGRVTTHEVKIEQENQKKPAIQEESAENTSLT